MQDRLALNKNKYKPESWKRYPFPLTELLVCGECGKHLGGKSGHGNGGKHFYYGHPRQLNSDGVTHLKRCQLENIRAPRMEEIVLQSLKRLLHEPGLMEHYLEFYAKSTSTEIPALEGKLRSLEQDIAKEERRNCNLTQRLSDLPSDISAEPIYEQLRTIQQKIKELQVTKDSLSYKSREATSRSIDRDQLLFRLRRTIQVLEKTPVEHQRPLFASIIKFTEVHATKIRMGVIAPTKASRDSSTPETTKATGTLGGLESPQRGGSCTVSFGAPSQT